MRHLLTGLLAAILFIVLMSSPHLPAYVSPADSVVTYRDIGGITDAEKAAIAAMKDIKDIYYLGVCESQEAYFLQDGSLAGFALDLCVFLSHMFEINIKPVIVDNGVILSKLREGEIDFVEGAFYEDDHHTSRPIAWHTLYAYSHVSADRITTEEALKGLRVGFLEGSGTLEAITNKAYDINFTTVDVEDYIAAAQMIRDGSIDTFIDESIADLFFDDYADICSTQIFKMVYSSVSIAAVNPDYDDLLSALDKFIARGGSERFHLLHKQYEYLFVKHKLSSLLTDQEKAYIDDLHERNDAVKVAYEHDNYPISFYNEEERDFQGIAVDVLERISDLTDIRFEPQKDNSSTWADIYRGLLTGETTMTTQLLRTREREGLFLWGKVPYARSRYVILSRDDYPKLTPYQVAWKTVGVISESANLEIYKRLFPEADNLRLYNLQSESLDALESGEIDLLMASEYDLLTQTNYREKPGFKINVALNAAMDSYFGFNQNETVLCSIMDKAQQFVDTSGIEDDWVSRHFDYSKTYAEEHANLLTFFLIIVFAILVLTVIFLINNVRLSGVLKKIASHDALTGIFNRRYFMEQAAIQIARSVRLKNECFVVMFDLDYFKKVNDTYGHAAGDKVLKEVAARIRKVIRPYDLFGRYGGEEFVLLMCDTDKENVINVTERIRQEVCKEPIIYENVTIGITASFGISRAAPVYNLNKAVRLADTALYVAKENGRNQVVFQELDTLPMTDEDLAENAI